ncbi:MAG TPA: fibronectin type III domain-containing protein [Sphingobacterium sp.]|nr:fibronectin type III domain-containing protein [Sphingobacterium sp.]
MKKLTMYCCRLVTLALLLASYSCKQEASDVGGVTDKIPENVTLWTYSPASITVAWDRTEGATSYTVQLLGSKDSDTPVDAYTTTSKDFYQFSGLQETRGYYARVRANVDYATGEWVYVMNGSQPGRIMPKYGFVDDDYEEPEPEPIIEPVLYPNFPEGWETHGGGPGSSRKPSHTGAGPEGDQADIFPSGKWLMPNMYTLSTASIGTKVGTWGLMMNANVATFLTMDFDLPYGASKLSFVYGVPTTTNANDMDVVNNSVFVKVEYSQDGGTTWTSFGDDLEVSNFEQYTKSYDLDIQGPVRFRIGKNNSRARLIVDEIAVYYLE